jgi:hypothetical protein
MNASIPGSSTVWACRSWFCGKRGPFWVRSRKDAVAGAREHSTHRFLGFFAHAAIVCPAGAGSVRDFLRKVRL